MVDETKLCSNCKRDISAANFVMHEMHCRRHIVLCEHCGEPVHRSEVGQHFSNLHAKIPCEKCQQMISKSDMAKHLEQECVKKLMKCEYCELSLPKNQLDEHLDYCGSRTECCPLCKQYIMQKDKLRHEHSRCTYPEPKPQSVDPFCMGDLQQLMTNAILGVQNATGASSRRGKATTNRKSELNARRAKNLTSEIKDDGIDSIPPDIDYDTMLALQLAHEDWLLDEHIGTDSDSLGNVPPYLGDNSGEFEDFNSFLSNGVENWSSVVQPLELGTPTVNSAVHDEDDDMSIPCEFCDVEVPLSIYIAHTDSCPQAPQRQASDLNNEQVRVQHVTSKASIPVINNLQTSNILPESSTYIEDENVMLPCEFCEETFPSDMIIQHQSVCQAEGLSTPRTTTPTTTYRSQTSQQPSSRMSFKPSIRSPPVRHTSPALIDFVGQDDSDEFLPGDESSASFQVTSESSSNKYSPAYTRFDEAVTRPPQRTVRKHNQSDLNGQELRRESKSAQRTHARLNSLLQEDLDGEPANVSNIRKPPAPSGSQRNHRTERRERKQKVDSRTVLRRMEETRSTPTQERKTPSHTTLDAAGSSQVPLPRNRRAEGVFSPELRLKPEHNPPPKKR